MSRVSHAERRAEVQDLLRQLGAPATSSELATLMRIPVASLRPRVAELVASGKLEVAGKEGRELLWWLSAMP